MAADVQQERQHDRKMPSDLGWPSCLAAGHREYQTGPTPTDSDTLLAPRLASDSVYNSSASDAKKLLSIGWQPILTAPRPVANRSELGRPR
jgi:hypothetical protein